MSTTAIKKHHYRKVFKSDHLGSADLEEMIEENKKLIFTIKHVKQQYGVTVAGKKGDHNIAYFVEPIKPLVLNATNCKTVKKFAGGSPLVEDWNNIVVELYIDPTVKMKGEVVGGVRIKPMSPGLPELTKESPAYPKVVAFIKAGGSFDDVETKHKLTEEIKTQITNDAK